MFKSINLYHEIFFTPCFDIIMGMSQSKSLAASLGLRSHSMTKIFLSPTCYAYWHVLKCALLLEPKKFGPLLVNTVISFFPNAKLWIFKKSSAYVKTTVQLWFFARNWFEEKIKKCAKASWNQISARYPL